MLKTQTFLKKTRRGNVIKVVREHYLRDDIYCGSSECNNCNHVIQSEEPDCEITGNAEIEVAYGCLTLKNLTV